MPWSYAQQSPCGSIMQSPVGEFGAGGGGQWFMSYVYNSSLGDVDMSSQDGATWFVLPSDGITSQISTPFNVVPWPQSSPSNSRIFLQARMQGYADRTKFFPYPSGYVPACEFVQIGANLVGLFSHAGGNVVGYSSDNGDTWNWAYPPAPAGWDTPHYAPRFITIGGSIFLAGGVHQVGDLPGNSVICVWTSPDGATWEGSLLYTTPDTTKFPPFIWKNGGNIYCQWYALNPGSWIYSANAGTLVWTQLTANGAVYPGANFGDFPSRTLALGDGSTLLMGSQSSAWTVDNGVSGPGDYDLTGGRGVYVNGGIVLVGNTLYALSMPYATQLMQSIDWGITWTAYQDTNLGSTGYVELTWLMNAGQTNC